jgi:PPP family 3-phenylpropionic acid transporter
MIMENGEELVYWRNFTMTARQFAARFSFCYAFLMAGSGLQLPFLPLWLSAKGLSVEEIAIVLGAMTGCRMLSIPLVAYVADMYRNRRFLLRVFGFGSAGGFLLLAQAEGFVQILMCSMLAATFYAPIFPLAEVFSSEASTVHGVQYGRIRLWASLSFLAGTLGGGLLLSVLPIESVVLLIALAQLVSALVLLTLPADPLRGGSQAPREGALPRHAIRPLVSRSFGLLLLAASLGQASHAMIYSFSSLLWARAGQSELAIGSFWAVAVMVEVLLLYNGKALIARFGALNLVVAGIAGGVLRWLLMSVEGGYAYWAMVQVLHALSFALLHLATMECLLLYVPRSARNLAQGIYSAASGGLALTLMTWVAGSLVGSLGSQTYLVMAAVSLVALAAALMLRRVMSARSEQLQL